MKDIITVTLPPIPSKEYKIHMAHGLLSRFHECIPTDLKHHAFVIITDENVKRLYGVSLQQLLAKYFHEVGLITLPAGENTKSHTGSELIESALIHKQLGRNTCLIALGGGVIGDLTGFTASTYMRGIPYIQAPTSLMAMIDSSIGGKTAINTTHGKNLIGSFWHPRCVIADLDCLSTLPVDRIKDGWIEALKIFLTCDQAAFEKATLTADYPLELIQKAVSLKAKIIQQDPDDQHIRAILNFGHTIGHAIELVTDYQIMHGHAVGYGILVESHIALQKSLITLRDYHRIVFALDALGIEGQFLKIFSPEDILSATRNDKKAINKTVRYVLLKGIGKVYIDNEKYTHPVSDNDFLSAIQFVTNGVQYGR